MERTVDRRAHVLGRRLEQRPAHAGSLHAQASRLVARDDRRTGAFELDAGIGRGRAEERIPGDEARPALLGQACHAEGEERGEQPGVRPHAEPGCGGAVDLGEAERVERDRQAPRIDDDVRVGRQQALDRAGVTLQHGADGERGRLLETESLEADRIAVVDRQPLAVGLHLWTPGRVVGHIRPRDDQGVVATGLRSGQPADPWAKRRLSSDDPSAHAFG